MYKELLNQLTPAAEVLKRYKKDASVILGLNELVDRLEATLSNLADAQQVQAALERDIAQKRQTLATLESQASQAQNKKDEAQATYDAIVAKLRSIKV